MTEAEQKFMFIWEMIGPKGIVGWGDSLTVLWEVPSFMVHSPTPLREFFEINLEWTPDRVRQSLRQRGVIELMMTDEPTVLPTLLPMMIEMEWSEITSKIPV